jgi:uncharacterized membrane protein
MDTPLKMLSELPWRDWLALVFFFGGWIGYAVWARRRAASRPSVLGSTNRVRREWMLQSTWRDNRVIDGVVVQNLSSAPSFFASTTILIIGGLLAVLSATERATELAKEIPFAARTSVLVFDFKLLLLTAIFVYAFFRFTWSLRQYSFGALLVASAPDARQFEAEGERAAPLRQAFADRAGRVMALAAETFNDGLRAYYMAFAALAWLFSPLAFIAATASVLWVLYRREFHSDVLHALNEGQSEG